MTLDEAIKHCEGVAEEKEIDIENQDPLFSNNIEECKKCAAEHRQLANWLKDYKRLLEQKPCDNAINRQWLMECVNEGWIKFDTEKDENRFIHLVRDIAPLVKPQAICEEREKGECPYYAG